jgi:predicted RNase H-like HicB family nuclease
MAKATTASGDAQGTRNIAPLRQLQEELLRLRRDLSLQERRLQETLAGLEIVCIGGYLVKVWPDLASGHWVAHCPTVRCVVQEATRDEAVSAITESIAEMLDVLATMGAGRPLTDVPAEGAQEG